MSPFDSKSALFRLPSCQKRSLCLFGFTSSSLEFPCSLLAHAQIFKKRKKSRAINKTKIGEKKNLGVFISHIRITAFFRTIDSNDHITPEINRILAYM